MAAPFASRTRWMAICAARWFASTCRSARARPSRMRICPTLPWSRLRSRAPITPSQRSHGQCHKVVDQADFLLNERLRITHTCQLTVVPGLGKGAFADLFLRHKQPASLLRVRILRPVRHQRGIALLDVRCDVNDEARPNISVEARIYDLVRSVRRCP